MVAWKILAWPFLLLGAGFAWICAQALITRLIPSINDAILNHVLSVQTTDAISFCLNMFELAPGIAAVIIGLGLVVDAVWHGGSE